MKNDKKPEKRSNTFYLVLSLIIITVIALVVAWRYNLFLTPYERFYAGDIRHFRGNLVEAAKVPVYPNELSLVNVLLDPDVFKIQIAFFPNDTENSYYFASSFEITNKISIIFRSIISTDVSTFQSSDGSSCLSFSSGDYVKCFKSVPINSTDEIFPTSLEPVILLLGPSKANTTAVSVDNYLITVEGKSFQETNRTYTDLDLVVDKLILVLMDYTSS